MQASAEMVCALRLFAKNWDVLARRESITVRKIALIDIKGIVFSRRKKFKMGKES